MINVLQVRSELGWSGSFGDCWMNATLDNQEFVAGCNYTDSERTDLNNFLYSWSDMTCFRQVFREACTVFLKTEFYAWSSSSSQFETTASGSGSGVSNG